MKNATVILTMLVAIALFAYAGERSPVTSSMQAAAAAKEGKAAGSAKQEPTKNSAQNNRGAELFETHCGRCHKPPDDLSPRIAPAVLSHMRTKAMLSREDEEELLKFLKP